MFRPAVPFMRRGLRIPSYSYVLPFLLFPSKLLLNVSHGSGRSAAWLARLVRDQEVGGSNPLAPTIFLSSSQYLTCQICTLLVRFFVYQALLFAKRLHATNLSSLNSWPYGEKCTSLRVSFLGNLGTGLCFWEKNRRATSVFVAGNHISQNPVSSPHD
jgi:hypothetical protein